MEIKEHIERISTLLQHWYFQDPDRESLQFAIQALQEVADGRRPLLPLRIEDTVYLLSADKTRVYDAVIVNMSWEYHPSRIMIKGYCDEVGMMFDFDAEELGKTVFLTREAAEKALEAGK